MATKILIMNMTRMGDLIQSTPLVMGLRKKYPQSHITLMVSSDFAEFSKRIPHIDEIIVFDLRQFKEKIATACISWVEIYEYLKNFLDGLIPRRFDLLVNLSHSKLSALMISYLGIKNVHGFACSETGNRKTGHPWMQYFGTEPFNRILNSYNLVDIFTRSGDVIPEGKQVTILTDVSDDLLIADKVREFNVQPGELLIGIQAGSSIEGRRWSAKSFAELADLLAKNLRARIVLFGVASEARIAGDIVAAMMHKDRVIDLSGKTNISELIGWVKKCQYLVTNDTGTMHIAAALGTKIVGLFFAHAHPHETGPYGAGHIIFQARIQCAPCSYGVQCNNIVCIQKVHPHHLYSMISSHISNGNWLLPGDMGGLDEMNIYETCFDDDYFLRMRPLIKRTLTSFDIYLAVYRKIWARTLMEPYASWRMPAETLDQIIVALQEDHDVSDTHHFLKFMPSKMLVFHQVRQMGEKGTELANQLSRIIKTKTATPEKMQALSHEIDELDKRICQAGLTHYEVKPITDMFSKRKENLEGDDVLSLAALSREYYNRMVGECALMIQAVTHVTDCLAESIEPITKSHTSDSNPFPEVSIQQALWKLYRS